MSIYCTQDPKNHEQTQTPLTKPRNSHYSPVINILFTSHTHNKEKHQGLFTLSNERGRRRKKTQNKGIGLHPHFIMGHGRQVLLIDGLGK